MTVILYLPFKYYHIITVVRNKKHFNQFTMTLVFYVILFCIIAFPLPEFVNLYGKIQYKEKSEEELTCDKLSVFKGVGVI